MDINEQMKFTKQCLDNVFNKDFYYWNVQENVPLDMQVGSVNEDGWVEWKLLDSHLGNEDILEY